MQQTQAVWLLTALSILTAGLPFIVQRPLVLWPWTANFGGVVWLRTLASVLHVLLLAGWGALALGWIGHSLATSALAVSGRVLGMVALLALLLGWSAVLRPAKVGTATVRKSAVANPAAADKRFNKPFVKPFISRLLEWLVLYGLMLTLGFALEAQLGNPFPQGWPFYAISLSLYVILAFPAFVWCYLLRR